MVLVVGIAPHRVNYSLVKCLVVSLRHIVDNKPPLSIDVEIVVGIFGLVHKFHNIH